MCGAIAQQHTQIRDRPCNCIGAIKWNSNKRRLSETFGDNHFSENYIPINANKQCKYQMKWKMDSRCAIVSVAAFLGVVATLCSNLGLFAFPLRTRPKGAHSTGRTSPDTTALSSHSLFIEFHPTATRKPFSTTFDARHYPSK